MEILWAFVVIGGPIVLGLAIAYGVVQYYRRDKRLDPVSERSAKKVRGEIRREENSTG